MPETTKTSDDDAAHLQVRLDPREQLQTVVVIPHPELASQALGHVRRAIDTLSGSPATSSTYDAAGRSAVPTAMPIHLDRAL